jgi:hypothetical protein
LRNPSSPIKQRKFKLGFSQLCIIS